MGIFLAEFKYCPDKVAPPYMYIDLKGVTDKNLPIANQLEFSTGTNDLISESNNWDEISKFKGKKLDIFGIDYNGPCKSKYMY
ncbi:hypothetical protein B8A12_15495, partial [Staphylococcus aureus]